MAKATRLRDPRLVETDALAHSIGSRVRALRKDAGLTIEQLAHATDLSTNHIGGVERGTANPSVEVLTKVAVVLEVDVSSLVDGYEGKTVAQLRKVARTGIAKMPAEDLRALSRILDAIKM